MQDFLEEKAEKIKSITTELSTLHHPHLEFVLLRSCLALPKFIFLLRTTDSTSFSETLQKFDHVTREGLSRIIGGPVTDQEWDQAKIPVCMGGLGLRAALDHGGAAFATSITVAHPFCLKLLHQEENSPLNLPADLLTNLSNKMGEEDVISSESLVGLNQRAVSVKIDLNNMTLLKQQFQERGCVRDIARLASVGIKDSHSGDCCAFSRSRPEASAS